MQGKQGLSQLDKKAIAIMLIVLIAIVSMSSLIYYVASQPNQNQNNLLPTPTPSPSEQPTGSSSIPTPSVPEFTVELVDSSYDVPTTYSTHPYTGDTITHEGYHVEARTIEIRIKNEPLSSFRKEGNSLACYYYNVQWKGQFEEEWHAMFFLSDGLPTPDEGAETVIARQGSYSPTGGLTMDCQGMCTTFPPNVKIEFRVEAMIGSIYRVVSSFSAWNFSGEESGWSETQTLHIP